MPAKPLRTALGSLLIQKQYQYSNRELVEQIRENPYFQYFIGLPGYQDEITFVPSLLVEFRKRLSDEVLKEINEMII
jgi:IS5 family transposase